MARLKPLLRYAILSNRRAFSLDKSGATRGLEICLIGGLIYAYARELKIVLTGIPPMRIAAGHLIILVLSGFWFFVPVSVIPPIPSDSIAAYPLSRSQAAAYRLISQWLDWKIPPLFAVSLIGVAALFRIPNAPMEMVRGIVILLFACFCGTAFALWTSSLRNRSRASAQRTRLLKMHRMPLFRKEFVYFCRTLYPYLGLLIAIVAGYSEIIASWMTPAEVIAPLLLISALQLRVVLNPFALSSLPELHRYRILPATFSHVLGTKHLALMAIVSLSASPLFAAVLYCQSLKDSLITLGEVGLVLIGFLLAGVLLMRARSARHIRMRFWSLSSGGMAIGLGYMAMAVNATPPLLSVLITVRVRSFGARVGLIWAELWILLLVYVFLLRRQRWEAPEGA